MIATYTIGVEMNGKPKDCIREFCKMYSVKNYNSTLGQVL